MWIKAASGLHDATGCSVRVQPEPKAARKPDEQALPCLALVAGTTGHVRVLERNVSPERGAAAVAAIENALMARQVLVEV